MENTDETLRSILKSTKVVACVGLSLNPVRPSYFVGRYLTLKNFRVIGINPAIAGKPFFGEKTYASLADVPDDIRVDMVDIFRKSEAVPEIVSEAINTLPHLKTIWMQIGVQHEETAQKARALGLNVVQNRCPKIEYPRLFGELRMGGFNTGVISSKL
jgi:predicted CoA-binding protein